MKSIPRLLKASCIAGFLYLSMLFLILSSIVPTTAFTQSERKTLSLCFVDGRNDIHQRVIGKFEKEIIPYFRFKYISSQDYWPIAQKENSDLLLRVKITDVSILTNPKETSRKSIYLYGDLDLFDARNRSLLKHSSVRPNILAAVIPTYWEPEDAWERATAYFNGKMINALDDYIKPIKERQYQEYMVAQSAVNKASGFVESFKSKRTFQEKYPTISGIDEKGKLRVSNNQIDKLHVLTYCYSPDSQMQCIGMSTGEIYLTDATGKTLIKEFRAFNSGVRTCDFSSDSQCLVACSNDDQIKIWDLKADKVVATINAVRKQIISVRLSPYGSLLATGGLDNILRIWDIKSGTDIIQMTTHKSGVRHIGFSPDLNLIASKSDDGIINIHNISQIAQKYEGPAFLAAKENDEKLRLMNTLPANLVSRVTYDDRQSLIPNNALDGGESSNLIIELINTGQGIAMNPQITLQTVYTQIKIDPLPKISDIAPYDSLLCKIPIAASIDVNDGSAFINIEVKEKRGYDARPVQLQIPVRHLDKPALSFANFTLNDGSSGQASGNGNGRAENGETVEVTAFVKNSGVGPALHTTVRLDANTAGAEIRQGSANLGTISPGETKQARMVVHIPRTFAGSQLQLSFVARDTIGASIISKEHVLPMSRLSPILAIESRFLDERGIQVDQLQNGARYVLEVVVRNEGQLNAKSVTSRISSSQITDLTTVSAAIGDLTAGASAAPVRFNFSLPRNYRAGTPQFSLSLGQVDFPDLAQNITIPILFKEPRLSIRDILSTSDGNQEISQGETVHIDVAIENTGSLDAESVIADLDFNHPGIDFRDRSRTAGRIPAGATSPSMRYSFLVKTGAAVGPLNGLLRVRQADGFPGTEKSYALEIKPIGAQVVTITPSERPTGAASFGQPAIRANSAPFIALSAKNISADNKSSDPFIKLEIQIQDDKPMLSVEPEIRVNGKLQTKELGLRGIDMQERETREADRKIRLFRQVELSEGLNDIEVRVYDADNEMSFDNVQIEYLSQRTDVYALVVGVGEYQSSSIDPLQFAAADAQSFHDYLRTPEGGGLGSDHIRLLLNGEATRDKILNAMEWLASRSFENDLVIIYMAMHGMVDQGEFYFLGYDSDPKSLFATGVKRSEVEALQQRLRSSKVVWFADACHSGSLGEDPQIAMRASRASSTNRLLGEIAKARNGLAMFMSAQYDQYSQESPKWGGGHGVFTYYLLKGLRGEADRNSDSFVTLSELYDFVSRQVSEATEGKQNPKLGGGTYDRSLTLSVVK